MADPSTLSICIPTFNRAGWLREAITSCLEQTDSDIEVVVSDNASDDDTGEVVASFGDRRIRYHRQPSPVPPVENWNSSWRAAGGELITFLCDDDALEPGFVPSMRDVMGRFPEASLYRSGLRAIDAEGRTRWEFTDIPESESAEAFLENRVRGGRLQFLPGFVCRRADIEAVAGVLEVDLPAMLYIDDYLWFRIAFRGDRVAGVNKALWSYRQHELQYGGDRGLDLDAFARGARYYTGLLVKLAEENGCSDELTAFLAEEYEVELLRTRFQLELRRARGRSLRSYLARLRQCLRLGRAHGVSGMSIVRSSW
jgi:glycosyltransferase involved in cell wall biosynthesis